jgi:Fe2+ or Zn2+ uptake regulation protein
MELGFRIKRRVVEIEGTCARCMAAANANATPNREKVLP